MTTLVQLNAAGVSLGGRQVLRGLDFELKEADVVGVVGPNGSGKTTLIRTLATLIPLNEGNGNVLDAELGSSDVLGVRRSIGMIGHTPALIPQLTLRENLIHVANLEMIGHDKVDKAIEVVGLDLAGDRLATESSFGMKRRIEVAHLLLRSPRLLLLDEAVAGLDTEARDLIGALVDRCVAADGAVMFVSHDQRQFSKLTQSVLRLSGGRLMPTK